LGRNHCCDVALKGAPGVEDLIWLYSPLHSLTVSAIKVW